MVSFENMVKTISKGRGNKSTSSAMEGDRETEETSIVTAEVVSGSEEDESPESVSLAASKSEALAQKRDEVEAVKRYYFLGYCFCTLLAFFVNFCLL